MDTGLFIQIVVAFMFVCGLLIMMLRKNIIMMLMGIELLLNAANLSMVAFSNKYHLLDGQLQVVFIITIAAAESAVGLSILINLFRNLGSSNSTQASLLKG